MGLGLMDSAKLAEFLITSSSLAISRLSIQKYNQHIVTNWPYINPITMSKQIRYVEDTHTNRQREKSCDINRREINTHVIHKPM